MSRTWRTLLTLSALAALLVLIALVVRSTGSGGASLSDDPFAGVTLAQHAPVAAIPTPATAQVPVGAPVLDQAELAGAVRAFAAIDPSVQGTALLSATVLPDGRVAGVRYLQGSLDPAKGEALAESLDAKKLYRQPSGARPTQAVLGPIAVN